MFKHNIKNLYLANVYENGRYSSSSIVLEESGKSKDKKITLYRHVNSYGNVFGKFYSKDVEDRDYISPILSLSDYFCNFGLPKPWIYINGKLSITYMLRLYLADIYEDHDFKGRDLVLKYETDYNSKFVDVYKRVGKSGVLGSKFYMDDIRHSDRVENIQSLSKCLYDFGLVNFYDDEEEKILAKKRIDRKL